VHPTSATEPLAEIALSVLRSELPVIAARGLTLLGLSVGNLESVDDRGRAAARPEQLMLPFGRKDRSQLDLALDSLRERFGSAVLTRASLLGRRSGFETPKLPD
jgi:DNA polymerase-4